MNKKLISYTGAICLLFAVSAQAQASNIHDNYNKVLKTYVKDGKVNYVALKQNRAQLDNYLENLAKVDKSTFNSWSKNKQLAYLINLYNADTLQLIIDHYPVKSIKDIGSIFNGPWDQKVVHLFGKTITLNNLEHDIIRKQYKEPRIHMALVCAAIGCPPLRSEAYTASSLDKQLADQSRTYLASPKGMRIDEKNGKVYLSKIFDWYGGDFPSVPKFVQQYSGKDISGLSRGWIKYNWKLNKQ